MESSILYLVAGFFGGTIITALLFFLIINNGKKKQAAILEERNQVIRSIAENFTEIDTLVTSLRTGLITEEKFRKSLNLKIDAANKIYKPNMHNLDLYYVKFTDSQFAKYSQLVHGKMTNFQLDGQSGFDSGIDESLSVQSLPEVPKSEKDSPEYTAGFFSDNPVNESFAEFCVDSKPKDSVMFKENEKPVSENSVKEAKNSLPENAGSVDAFSMIDKNNNNASDSKGAVDTKEPDEVQIITDTADNQISAIEFSSMGADDKPVLIDQEPVIVDEKPFVIDEKSVTVEDIPEDEEPTVVFEEFNPIGDSQLSSSEDNDGEITFEVGADADSKLISDTSSGVNKTADSMSTNGSVVSNPEEQKSSFQKEFELVAKEPHDEDLMETIMDLDMGKFLRTGSINIDSIDKKSLPPRYSANVKASDGVDKTAEKTDQYSNSEGSAFAPLKSVSSASEIDSQEKIVVARGDDGNSNTTLDDVAANFETNSKSDDLKDVTITGDDVASKIDLFFGIK